MDAGLAIVGTLKKAVSNTAEALVPRKVHTAAAHVANDLAASRAVTALHDPASTLHVAGVALAA